MVAVAGAVLAGGRSRRMGHDKALVEIDGRPMGRVVLDALAEVGIDPLVVVGGDPALSEALGAELLPDLFPGEGPLGGVLTALEHFAPVVDHVLVAACDLPEIGRGALAPMLERISWPDAQSVDVVVARADAVQPTCALWATTRAADLRAAFEAGERSMFGALDSVRVVTVDVPSRSLRNINTPEQLGE